MSDVEVQGETFEIGVHVFLIEKVVRLKSNRRRRKGNRRADLGDASRRPHQALLVDTPRREMGEGRKGGSGLRRR